jgi:hypothetical protein
MAPLRDVLKNAYDGVFLSGGVYVTGEEVRSNFIPQFY